MVLEGAADDAIEDAVPLKAVLPTNKGTPVPCAIAAGHSHLLVLSRCVCVCVRECVCVRARAFVCVCRVLSPGARLSSATLEGLF